LGTIPSAPGAELNAYARDVAASWLRDLEAIDAAGEPRSSKLLEQVAGAMSQHLNRLAATGVWGPDNRVASEYLWKIMGERLRTGSLQLHAREKPYGYAGDYRLLDRICRHDVQGQGSGRAYDEFFQQQTAPHAVRNRARLLANEIVSLVQERDEPLHIASYGSGPAYELRSACAGLPPKQRERLQITLLDIDPHALEFATGELSQLLPQSNVNAQQANLARLPKLKRRTESLRPADFVFAAGFFDYLEHADAVNTIQFVWQQLRPLGKMFIFNFCESNSSRAYMEWIGNWYLTYRSDDDLQAWARDSELPAGSWQTDIEEAGVNRFLTAMKPA
jgi:hypothetical protein